MARFGHNHLFSPHAIGHDPLESGEDLGRLTRSLVTNGLETNATQRDFGLSSWQKILEKPRDAPSQTQLRCDAARRAVCFAKRGSNTTLDERWPCTGTFAHHHPIRTAQAPPAPTTRSSCAAKEKGPTLPGTANLADGQRQPLPASHTPWPRLTSADSRASARAVGHLGITHRGQPRQAGDGP